MIRALLAPPRRARTLLAAAGVLAASLVVGTAATVGFGLATGFERSARQADLPHVIARFDRQDTASLDQRIRALPNVAARSYRLELRNVALRGHGQATRKAILEIVLGGRRGYAVTAGRDARGPGELVVERGLARAWHLAPGARLRLWDEPPMRVVGVAVAPDNVAFPLTLTPKLYGSEQLFAPDFRPHGANVALLWLADRGRTTSRAPA